MLWNCKKNESIELSSELSITKVDATHFLNNYKIQSKIEHRNKYRLSNRNENSEIDEILNFNVIGNYAKYIEQNNYNSYTFSITRENPIDGIQENFFLSLQPDGTYKEFLVWYYLDEQTFSQAENDISLLIGQRIKMIDLDLLEENNTASRSGFGDMVNALPNGCYEAVFCNCDNGGGYAVKKIPCPSSDSSSGNVGAPGTSSTSGSGEGGSSGGGSSGGGSGAGEPAQIPDTTSPVVCGNGYELYNGSCVPICGRNSSRNFNTGGCDCDTGFETDDEGDCVEDDKIDNFLNGKALCVYSKMVDSNNNINWILENFQDSSTTPSQFNLVFKMSSSLGTLTNASTVKSGNTFTISINENRAENINTVLTIARTILHEGIHARLREFASRDGSNETSFPGIYDYFRRYAKNWDHQQMAEHYRSTIAEGLKQYDNSQHSDSFYDALAWEGLSEIKDANGNQDIIYTEAWNQVSPQRQQEVLQIITNEKQNGNKNCQ